MTADSKSLADMEVAGIGADSDLPPSMAFKDYHPSLICSSAKKAAPRGT